MREQVGQPRPRNRLPPEQPKDKGGRPPRSINKLARDARERAEKTGALPHELLLQWARGEPMSRKVLREGGDPKKKADWVTAYEAVDCETQRDSAKAAAPYYAPKISTVEVVTGVSDADLDEFIARAAAEAGVSVGTGRESPTSEDEDDQPSSSTPQRRRAE